MPPKKSKPASKGKAQSQSKSQSKEQQSTASKRKRSPTPPSSPSTLKALLHFLLNDAPQQFSNGSDASQPNLFDHMQHSKDYTPFQNLVAAVVMSKPISSRLGARTLLTVFGEEVDFSTPGKLRDAGEEGRYDALSKARTQHKDKTALQLGRLADKVIEEYAEDENDTSLIKMKQELGDSSDKLAGILKSFYGFGDMAADIFRRSMQAEWAVLYPFADERTMNAAAHLGLSHDFAESLANQVKELLPPAKSEEEERKQFTRIVDALVAVDLEHKYEEVLEAVQKTGDVKGEGDGEEEEPKAKVAKKDEEE